MLLLLLLLGQSIQHPFHSSGWLALSCNELQTLHTCTIVRVYLSFIIMNYVRKALVIDFDLLLVLLLVGDVCCPLQWYVPHNKWTQRGLGSGQGKGVPSLCWLVVAVDCWAHIVTEILEFIVSLGNFIVYYINFQYLLCCFALPQPQSGMFSHTHDVIRDRSICLYSLHNSFLGEYIQRTLWTQCASTDFFMVVPFGHLLILTYSRVLLADWRFNGAIGRFKNGNKIILSVVKLFQV